MEKQVVFTEQQINQVRAALEGISVKGVQNSMQIAYIAQILNQGQIKTVKENKT